VNKEFDHRISATRSTDRRPRRRRFGRFVAYALVLSLVGGVVYILMSQAPNRPGPGGRFGAGREAAVPVLAAAAQTADVPVYLDGVGTIRALNTVTVRSQVDGKLISINFREGQDVEQGYVLAEVDPTVYQAALDQAVAKKAQDEAQLANARMDLERYTRLAQTNASTKQQADTQRAQVAQIEALVKSDQGAIDNARAILGFTKIVAPISGRTGLRQVDVGNLVRAADATGIVVITQIKPIAVIFNLPQQQLARVNKAFAAQPLTVEAIGADGRTVVDRGTLQVVDNQVDQTTGTVRLKAEFPNADLQLWPGQFVNVRLLVDTLKQVVVAPTAAVQRGPTGTFVYVVSDDNTVSVRPVTVAQQDDTQAVIASGLDPGARVVTTGFNQLTDGKRVTVGGETNAPPAGERRRVPGAVQSGPPTADDQRGQRRNRRTEGAARSNP
jgi:multidrug efflux system membrane fusion protein